MRPVTVQMLQGSDLDLVLTPTVGGEVLSSIDSALFMVYKNDTVFMQKSLGENITFLLGEIIIQINPEDTTPLLGSYKYEVLIEVGGERYFAAYGIFDVVQTKARII